MLHLNIFDSTSSQVWTDHCQLIKSNVPNRNLDFIILQPVERKPERTFYNGITVTNLFTSKLDSLDSFEEDCFSQ